MVISGRRLAIDYGDVRIGISLSDPSCIIASPFTTLSNSNVNDSVIAEIVSIVSEHAVVVIYLGLPLHLSGAEGESATKVRAFAKKLKEALPESVTLRLIDERLTTTSAQRRANDSGGDLSKTNVDQWAAVAILESALAGERNRGELAGTSA